MKTKIFLFLTLFIYIACTNNVVSVKNPRQGELQATHQLVVSGEKRFFLDAGTAPHPPYVQIVEDSLNRRVLTFLNPYQNAIYFYNYEDTSFVKKIAYEREGANAVLKISGYYIKGPDSIYLYNMPMTEVDLTNSAAEVQERVSLRGNSNNSNWPRYYPQYLLSTVNSFILRDHTLILTGQSCFSIQNANIDKFKFSAYINTLNNLVEFHHTYPREIYGNDVNWEGGLPTLVFPALTADNELIFSFPASHHLYLTKEGSDTLKSIYGGSNVARTIHSINYGEPVRTPEELIMTNYLQEDMYGAILYDPYREVYYRFLLQGIPQATIRTSKEEKPVTIIIMDKEFNYIGETTLITGKEWNWNNSFITSEGLTIEYLDNNDSSEDYLIFKTLIPEAL